MPPLARVLCLLVMAVLPCALWAQEEVVHPEMIDKCLENPRVGPRVSVQFSTNPYYLRGDFDGDGAPDYAVDVKNSKLDRYGVLVCLGNGKAFLLGVEGPPFSNMPGDRFRAPHWEVYTRKETVALREYQLGVPSRIPDPKGETIAMMWEDGIGLIYWDGKAFKWSGTEP